MKANRISCNCSSIFFVFVTVKGKQCIAYCGVWFSMSPCHKFSRAQTAGTAICCYLGRLGSPFCPCLSGLPSFCLPSLANLYKHWNSLGWDWNEAILALTRDIDSSAYRSTKMESSALYLCFSFGLLYNLQVSCLIKGSAVAGWDGAFYGSNLLVAMSLLTLLRKDI